MAFKNIRNIFFVDDEDEKKEEVKKKEPKQETRQENKQERKETKKSSISWKSSSRYSDKIKTSQPPQAPPQDEVFGNFNQKIFDSLTKAIANANLPGEDYLEFIQALKAMKDIPLEESLKIRTVLATLSTKGLTIQKIYESADYYLKIMENEKKKFYGAFENMAKSGIGKKKEVMQNLQKINQDKADLIAKLTEEIKTNQGQIETVKKEITESEKKIKSTENDFLFTYDKIANQIKNNVDKIKKL